MQASADIRRKTIASNLLVSLGLAHAVFALAICFVVAAIQVWWVIPIDPSEALAKAAEDEWLWMVAAFLTYPVLHAGLGMAYALGRLVNPLPMALMAIICLAAFPVGTVLGVYTLWRVASARSRTGLGSATVAPASQGGAAG
jgi:succinate dehydrogenase hydrophobic anchor subunit